MSARSKVRCTVAMALLLCLVATGHSRSHGEETNGDVGQAYRKFTDFCTANFGAEKEKLVYSVFGDELRLSDEGLWVHESETSAAISFETNLPAKAHVEYGKTAAYGEKTDKAERHFYVHLHRLKDLQPQTEYHYRLVATDERGNRITSPDRTLKTRRLTDAVRIPQDLPGPPYELTGAGKTYLVTEDLTIEGHAFDVKANNVTLDLGGHTVIYDSREWGPIKSGNFWDWIRGAKYGVRASKITGLKILNGAIRQGAGNDAAQANSIGYNPIYLKTCSGSEIAGLELVYSGPQQIGIYNHWGGNDSEVHHNVFLDLGTKITNRHGAGSRPLLLGKDVSGVKVHHNLVKRTRQGGLSGSEVYHNEVCMDSWATNSFGVSVSNGGKAYGNRVMGGGYHVCAFGWGNGLTISGNFVHLRAEMFPENRWQEYGKAASVNGMRLTQYSGSKKPYHNNRYHDNVIVINAKDGRQVRGVQIFSDPHVKDFVFQDNTVKVTAEDEKTKRASCIVAQGLHDRADEHLPVLYKDNTFISNVCHVRFGDDYGVGSNHRFINCRFVKIGDLPGYHAFVFPRVTYPSKNHVVRDGVFRDGAAVGDVLWQGGPHHDLAVEWSLTVRTVPGAKVTVADKAGKQVFAGEADGEGRVVTPLTQYVHAPSGKTMATPHTVAIEKDDQRETRKVTMDGVRELTPTKAPLRPARQSAPPTN